MIELLDLFARARQREQVQCRWEHSYIGEVGPREWTPGGYEVIHVYARYKYSDDGSLISWSGCLIPVTPATAAAPPQVGDALALYIVNGFIVRMFLRGKEIAPLPWLKRQS